LEVRDLRKAERDIVEGERRLSEQLLVIAHLEADGHDTAAALSLLRPFEASLTAWREHRDGIQRLIE
jgi:hypothetical protein